jgi:phosphoribosyl-AMP cyclohydrolase
MARPSIFPPQGSKDEVEGGTVFQPRFDADGLIPAIVSDAGSGEMLMFAWMNADALAKTLATSEAWFWSRSRARLWRKGEESGNTLSVHEVRVDCDQDVLLLKVSVAGNGLACHTGARSCFYRTVQIGPADNGRRVLSRQD